MFLNPRQDLFSVFLTDQFFEDSIISKYNDFLKQYPYTIDNMSDVINESIQEIELPAFGYQPIEQNSTSGYSALLNYLRPNENIQNLFEKTFTISFRHTEGYLTYFCMLEHFFQFYDFTTGQSKKDLGTLPLQTLLPDGQIVSTINFERVLLTGISGLPLSYSNEDRSFRTFDLTFQYSTLSTSFNVPERKLST